MAAIKFAGLASGIDSASLIDALIASREAQNLTRKKEVDYLEEQNTVLEELNTKVLALNDLVERFRTINGGGVLKKGTSSDSTVATASVAANAINSSFGVTVNTLAKSATGTLSNSLPWTSTTAVIDPLVTGSIQVNAGSPSGSNPVSDTFTVTAGVTTLQDLVSSINSSSALSGRVSASLVNTGTTASPSFKVVMNTPYQGTDLGQLGVTVNVLTGVTYSESDATNATFDIAGIGSFTRETNAVTDVFTGVTFNLLKGGGSSTTITIGTDSDGTADQINQIIKQYNDIVEFIKENDTAVQDANDRNGNIIFGSLAKTKVDNNFVSQFKTALLSATSSTGVAIQTFSDLDIATNRDGTMTLDIEALRAKIASDPTGTSQVLNDFADAAGGTDGVLYQFTKFRGFIDIAQESNLSTIDNLNKKIAQVERGSEKVRSTLELQFSRLESLTGRLQGQQQALTGILQGLR